MSSFDAGARTQGQSAGNSFLSNAPGVGFGNSSQFGGSQPTNTDSNENQNLWTQLLRNVRARGEIKQANLLLLGDRGAGKRSLIKSLNKPFIKHSPHLMQIFDELGSDFSLFESSYLYIRDISEYGEMVNRDQDIGEETMMSRINVWIINEEEMGVEMIPKIITPDDLEHTFAIIMPDLEQPWDLMNHTKKWIQVLKDSIFKISPNLDLRKMEKLREKIANIFKVPYEEPEFDKDGKFISKKILKKLKMNTTAEMEGDSQNLSHNMSKLDDIDVSILEDEEMREELRKEEELPEGTLVTNLFIPVAIVCSKTDLIEHGDKEIKSILEKNLDYIQYTMRKFCLEYGASLVFTSANSNSNMEMLYAYIVHRIYDQDFQFTSNINDKEALFIPSGRDSKDLIDNSDLRQFQKNLKNQSIQVEPSYEEVVLKPERQKHMFEERKQEIKCQDWKSQLESFYQTTQERQSALKSGMGKMGKAAGATSAANKFLDGIKNPGRSSAKLSDMQAIQGRPSVGGQGIQNRQSTAGQKPGDAQPKAQTNQPPSAKNATQDKARKNPAAKEFYSTLLNKKQTMKKSGQPPTPSAKDAEQPPAQNTEDAKQQDKTEQ